MPKNKDLKRLVRTRMEKTGESYTTARHQLVEKKKKTPPPASSAPRTEPEDGYAELAGISDEAVKKATGCIWKRWVSALDRARAFEMKHREIAQHISTTYRVTDWWAQMVAVGYERIRGLRDKGQRRDGRYDVNKSKTIGVPIRRLYQAFATKRSRSRWLGDVDLEVKKSTVDKSVRIRWEDGTAVDAYFWAKGAAKSQVQLQHRQLPSKAAAEKVRAFWTERLARLGELLVSKSR